MADEQNNSSADMISRVTERLDTSRLSRQSMKDGGEVFRGELATRALKSVGARAMTIDETIIVGDDFDTANPEDLALYAHEQHHVEHGDGHGGGGGENFRDAEEIAARAAESMALHRAVAGGTETGYSQSAGHRGGDLMGGGEGGAAGPGEGSTRPDHGSGEPTPEAGYDALRTQGLGHGDIVNDLAQRVLNTLDEMDRVKQDRHGDKKGFI
jgi:hypothetical protein